MEKKDCQKVAKKKLMESSQRSAASAPARRSGFPLNNKEDGGQKKNKTEKKRFDRGDLLPPGQEDFCFTFVTQRGHGGPRPSPPPWEPFAEVSANHSLPFSGEKPERRRKGVCWGQKPESRRPFCLLSVEKLEPLGEYRSICV